jgi:predicted AlkP superfamily phosphohydrolase/phosphomutase
MGGLAAEGEWRNVEAYAHLSAATMWPTFVTGRTPEFHGVSGDMNWNPQRMEMVTPDLTRPIWAGQGGHPRVGTLDIPFMMPTGRANGFEVCAWGPHWFREYRPSATPESAAARMNALREYPVFEGLGPPPAPTDSHVLETLGERSVAGIRLRTELATTLIEEARPDLAIIVFPEIHTAGHALWHTVEPSHRLYKKMPPVKAPATGGIHQQLLEVDHAIGRLLEAAPDAAVVVFSLHGMTATGARPSFLSPLFHERGWSSPLTARIRNGGSLARNAAAKAKRRAPSWVRRRYHKVMPRSTVRQIASKTTTTGYDWAGTRAFAFAIEQSDGIRVNLRGRERDGIVAKQDYRPIVDTLASELSELKTTEGRSLVSGVFRGTSSGEPHPTLPDLVVHWTEDAYDPPFELAGSTVTSPAVTFHKSGTGRHLPTGFCIARGLALPEGPVQGDRLAAHLIEAAEG